MKEGANFKDHSEDVTGLCFADHPSHKYLLSCSEDELICLSNISLKRDEALMVAVPTQLPLLECGFLEQSNIPNEEGLVWGLTSINSLVFFDLATC